MPREDGTQVPSSFCTRRLEHPHAFPGPQQPRCIAQYQRQEEIEYQIAMNDRTNASVLRPTFRAGPAVKARWQLIRPMRSEKHRLDQAREHVHGQTIPRCSPSRNARPRDTAESTRAHLLTRP